MTASDEDKESGAFVLPMLFWLIHWVINPVHFVLHRYVREPALLFVGCADDQPAVLDDNKREQPALVGVERIVC